MSSAVASTSPMVARMVRTGTGRRSAPRERVEVTGPSFPRPGVRNPVEANPSSRRARPADLRQARPMSTPEPSTPQPRDIALEQETPEQAAELEAPREPDPGGDAF